MDRKKIKTNRYLIENYGNKLFIKEIIELYDGRSFLSSVDTLEKTSKNIKLYNLYKTQPAIAHKFLTVKYG